MCNSVDKNANYGLREWRNKIGILDTEKTHLRGVIICARGGNKRTDARIFGMSNMSIGPLHVEEIANEINQLSDGKKESDFKIASLAAKANKEMSAAMKKQLHAKLKMDKTKFSRYVFIGKVLPELEKMKEYLPEGYSLLHAIARLSVTDRQAALEAKVIHPKMTRAQLKAWLAKRAGKEMPESAERVLATVRVDPKLFSLKALDALCDALNDLTEEYTAGITFLCEPSDGELSAAWDRRTRHIVRAVQRIVGTFRKKAFQGKKNLTRDQQLKVFGFHPDEVDLDNSSGEEDAKRVLETIGRGDEFARICRDADDLYDPGIVRELKLKKFAQKDDDDGSAITKIAPVLAKAKANLQRRKPKAKPVAEGKRKRAA